MAKIEVKTEETRCDRCDRKVTKTGHTATILGNAPTLWAAFEVFEVGGALDLCKSCGESLAKWWARGKAGDE